MTRNSSDRLFRQVDRVLNLGAMGMMPDLEGLTYGATAQQLGLSEGTLRGRLAQARKRMHRQLTWRGVTVPAVLLKAAAPGHLSAPVPSALVHSTSRIVLGSTSANTAAILAREVMKMMVLNQLKGARQRTALTR